MKKAIFYMIAGAVLLIIILLLMPEQETSPEVTIPEVTTNVVQRDYSKEEYMKGCVGDPTYYDYCECTYNYLKLTIEYNIKDSIKDTLRKKWYASLHTILMKSEIYPNAEIMRDLDEQLRESIFPVTEGDIIEPKRMRNMSADELKTCITILCERHPECL